MGSGAKGPDELAWDDSLSVVSQVHTDPEEAIKLVRAVGLPASVALRPFRVLSRGEQESAEVARRIGAGACEAKERTDKGGDATCVYLDEFTSSLDRRTAKAVCHGVARWLRATPLPVRLVVATVHYDILPWVFESATGEVTSFEGDAPTAEDVDAAHTAAGS